MDNPIKNKNTSWVKNVDTNEAPRYNLKAPQLQNIKNLPLTTKNLLHMYSPFLWRIAKGHSLIIKRRWRRRPSKTLQICSQGTNLIKHVHQKLTIRRLSGHDSLQRTMNVLIIRSRRWWNSNSSSSRIDRCLSRSITCRGGRRRCTRRLNPMAFRACSHLSSPLPKKGGTYRSYDMNGLIRKKLL